MSALPTVVVIGQPQASQAFTQAGYPVVDGDPADLAAVAGATRSMRQQGINYLVLTASPDTDRWRQWIDFEAASHPTGVFGETVNLPTTTTQVLNDLGLECSVAPVVIGAEADVVNWHEDPFHPADVVVQQEDPFAADVAAPSPTPSVPEPYVRKHAAPEPDWMDDLGAPQPAPVVPVVPTAKPVLEDVFGSPGDEFRYTRTAEALCPVIFVVAGKGGVGKTTWTLALGENAANRWPAKIGADGKKSPPKIIVVDMNRGQPDLGKYLRIASQARANTPTIHDVAVSGKPLTGLMGPTAINNVRVANLPPVSVGAVLGPPSEDKADPEVVTPAVYAATIRALRAEADLVIVDTQILEMVDTSGLHDGVTWPLLISDPGAWVVALTDSSMAGVSNLLDRLASAQDRKDAPADRAMVVLNRGEPGSSIDVTRLAAHVATKGTFLGEVPASQDVSLLFEQGRIPYATQPLRSTLDAALYRVTGMSVFNVAATDTAPQTATSGPRKRRFWQRTKR